MSWWALPVAAILAVELVAQPPTIFRARVEGVRLDVLATRNGVPVAGLTADDFEVRDNGVAQRVSAARTMEAVQLGVVLDASGSMTGDRIAIVRAATAELIGQLGERDSIAIVAFGDQVASLARRSRPDTFPIEALERLRAAGSTALVDGIYAGLLETGHGTGPKLLLVMTDGRNNMSALRGSRIIDVARRLETAIYPVAVDVDGGQEARARSRQGDANPRQGNPATFGRSIKDERLGTSDAIALLRVLANETGGRAIEAGWNATLGAAFRGVLDEYRQRYTLSYTPEGVATGDGWHTLDVRVRRNGVTVRSRTRYWSGT